MDQAKRTALVNAGYKIDGKYIGTIVSDKLMVRLTGWEPLLKRTAPDECATVLANIAKDVVAKLTDEERAKVDDALAKAPMAMMTIDITNVRRVPA